MPLTTEEKNIIGATVPILEQGGVALTTHFYQKLMRDYPQVQGIFNQTHQKDGSQPRALAYSVLGYAKNIDHLENLGTEVGRIVQKHVALDIKPEHYPLVGTALIKSMVEVLGPETANDTVIGAWTKAYNQLADLLIGAEKKESDAIAAAPGGWEDWRPFVISQKRKETHNITSFYLKPQDGKQVYKGTPGQFITIRVFVDGKEARRNYSVSDAPSDNYYRISVKAPGQVSSYLHGLEEGAVIQVRPPVGDFVVDPAHKNIALVAGGVGITPLAAMALSGITATLYYFAHSPDDKALLPELSQCETLKIASTQGSRPSADTFSALPKDAHVYVTGPEPFMIAVHKELLGLGIPKENIHHEFFNSDSGILD